MESPFAASSMGGVLAGTTEKAAVICVGVPILAVTAQNIRQTLLTAAQEQFTSVTILINSSGGSTLDGLAIYNLMKSMPYKIHTHNFGVVHSISNLIYLGGETRTMAPESNFMFHSITDTIQGTLEEVQIAERMAVIKQTQDEFIRIVSRHTKWDADTFNSRRLFERASIIKPDDAIEAGIAHEITDLKIPAGIATVNIVGA